MKKYLLKIFMLIIFLIQFSLAQEEERTTLNIPAVGDTLDREERDFYKLFPNVKDFEWAVFYPDEKDAVTARVCYRVLDNFEYRTYENYMAGVNNINHYLEEIDKVSASTQHGKEVTICLNDDKVVKGELISVRQDSILIFPAQGSINLIDDSNLILILNKSEIVKIVMPNDRNFFVNCLISSYTGGAIVGLLSGGIAFIATKNESESNYTPALIALIGWLVGTVVTYIIMSGDYEIEINLDYNLSDLKEYARFESFEPMYLKQIK